MLFIILFKRVSIFTIRTPGTFMAERRRSATKCRRSTNECRRSKIECRIFVAEHRRSLAIAEGRSEFQMNIECLRRMSHLRGNMRRRFWRKSRVATVANELMENWQNMCYFGDNRLLYKWRGIAAKVLTKVDSGDCRQRTYGKLAKYASF